VQHSFIKKEEAVRAPLLNALLFYSEESQREAEPFLPKIFPLSLEGEV
jgi:hypothetical protein